MLMKSCLALKMSKDIKIGSKREALFTEVRDATKQRIKSQENNLEVDRELLKLCEKIIKEEQ